MSDKTRELVDKCLRQTESVNSLGTYFYSDCNRKISHEVEYKSGTRGNLVKEKVCKMHFNSVKKYAERMLKKFNYDVELKVKSTIKEMI